MNQPSKRCNEEEFRTLHKLCARLTRKMPYALYLCVLHTWDRDAEHTLSALRGGEVYCEMQPGTWYILLFAEHDDAAQHRVRRLEQLSGSALRLQRVTQHMRRDPDIDN